MIRAYLARQYTKLYPREMFVGVTGFIGKTSTALASLAVLSQKYKSLATKSSSDLLKINPSIKKVISELDHYHSILKPKTVVFSKIDQINSESWGEIIESLESDEWAILNWDDPNSKKLASLCKGSVVYYGTDPSNSLVWAGNIKIENYRTTFELNLGVERVKVNYKFLGTHQIYPALAAAALGVIFDIPLTKIKLALESLEPLEYHLKAVIGPNSSIILDDSVNGSQASAEAAIDTLLEVPARRRILALAEMDNLGYNWEEFYRQIAQKIYKEKIDFVFLGQGDIQAIAEELKSLGFWEEKVESNLQNSKIVTKLLKLLGKGDVCLIKGSKAVRLDEVVKRIAKKQ